MTPTVEFRKSGRTIAWAATDSLLTFAEENGVEAPYSCGASVCGT
jgi:ferredoxin